MKVTGTFPKCYIWVIKETGDTDITAKGLSDAAI